MPTTYTGDPTATEAPDVAPEPETAIVINIPIATEGRTVSSIQQGFKNLTNQASWLKKPKAKSADYAGGIMAYRTALGHRRFRVDHMALPSGKIQHWREHWPLSAGGIAATGTVGPIDITTAAYQTVVDKLTLLSQDLGAASLGADLTAVKGSLGTASGHALDAATALAALRGTTRWQVQTKKTTGTSSVTRIAADAIMDSCESYMTLQCGNTTGDFATLFAAADAVWTDSLSFRLEWDLKLEAADLVKLTAAAGFALESGVSPFDSSPPVHYAVFSLAPGAGDWMCSYRGGGSAQSASSGVAASTSRVRMRIEFHGATVADNTTRTVRFLINGAVVGTFTSDIPTSAARAAAHFSLINTGSGASGLTNPLNVGVVDFASNLYPSDVA